MRCDLGPAGERAADIALAAVFVLLPLLPSGPRYFGSSSTAWVEAALPFLAVLLLALVVAGFRARVSSDAPTAMFVARDSIPTIRSRDVVRVLAPFVLAATGAALVGLRANNVLSSPAFLANLRAAPRRLFAPMDQVTDPLYPLRLWLTFLEGPAAFMLVLAICRRAADPARRARAALVGAAIGLALVSGFAVFQYFARFHLNPHWALADPNVVRADSTLEDPNTLGSYLVFGLGLAMTLLAGTREARRTRWRSALTTAAIALAAAALVTSVSRAALGAAVLSAVTLLAYGPSWGTAAPRRIARRAIGAIAILFLVWLGAGLSLRGRADYRPAGLSSALLETFDPRVPLSDVLKGRPVLWMDALQMARAHPLAGVGLGRYPRVVGDVRGFATRVENAHNFFLQVLAEMGGIGLLSFLLIVAAVTVLLRHAARAEGRPAAMAWGVSFAALAFSLTLFAGHPLLLPSVQLVVATGLAAGFAAILPAAPDAVPRRSLSWRLGVVVAALAAVYGTAFARTTWQSFGDSYGYTSGLYAPERDASKRTFRWSGSEAMLHVPVPMGATSVRLQFAVFRPEAGQSTMATVDAAGHRLTTTCPDDGWRQVSVPIDPATAASGAVDIRFTVDRVVVPAAAGGSTDTRVLGAMLRSPTFTIGPAGR